VGKKAKMQMAGCHGLCALAVLMHAPTLRACNQHKALPLRLTAGVSSHLLQVFHRKLCARKSSLRGLQ
jgi:hypothetical protein